MKNRYIRPDAEWISCMPVDILTVSGMGEQMDDIAYFDGSWRG